MHAARVSVLAGILGTLTIAGCSACGNSEREGAEAARQKAEAEASARAATAAPAKRISTPVPGQAHVPCTQLIDPAVYQTAMGEKLPLGVKDVTKGVPDASVSCSLLRGGKRPSEAEQKALLKRDGKLGVLPGDELCNVTAFCSSIEDPERFKDKCKRNKDHDDDSLGSYACVHITAVGEADVKSFRLLDEDTRCVLLIRGGPSNTDNAMIQSCAKAARDAIGPAQIKVDAAAPIAGSAS
jgi:hypothetical protein